VPSTDLVAEELWFDSLQELRIFFFQNVQASSVAHTTSRASLLGLKGWSIKLTTSSVPSWHAQGHLYLYLFPFGYF